MPEIGAGAALFFASIAFAGGIIIGTQLPLWVQGILLIAVILLNRSWAVRGLEIGAIAYFVIGMALIGGMVVGDISYFIQTGMEFGFDIPNLFKVN
jgi:hypothetical protein